MFSPFIFPTDSMRKKKCSVKYVRTFDQRQMCTSVLPRCFTGRQPLCGHVITKQWEHNYFLTEASNLAN